MLIKLSDMNEGVLCSYFKKKTFDDLIKEEHEKNVDNTCISILLEFPSNIIKENEEKRFFEIIDLELFLKNYRRIIMPYFNNQYEDFTLKKRLNGEKDEDYLKRLNKTFEDTLKKSFAARELGEEIKVRLIRNSKNFNKLFYDLKNEKLIVIE